MFAKVIVDISSSETDRVFDYFAIEGLKRGHRVSVPFGSRTIEGYVIELSESSDYPQDKIKPIASILDKEPVISSEMFKLSKLMIERYNLKIVDTLRLFIPSQMRRGRVKELTRLFAQLNPEFITDSTEGFIKPNALAQQELYEYLINSGGDFVSNLNKDYSASALKNFITRGIVSVQPKQVLRKPFVGFCDKDPVYELTKDQKDSVKKIIAGSGTFLLHGVTGSGKTEVYMQCIHNALKQGKTAIMLVPEISLTPQVFSRFKSRFGEAVAILHSGLSAGERFDEWTRLISGEAVVAIGARSAIFAPLTNLGIIIIDEEHDQSYNSDSNPRYITSEIAHFRAEYNSCNLVLGSATPSVETYYKADQGEYKLLEMHHRINNQMPSIKVVNMCDELYSGNDSLFSAELYSRLKECLAQGEQAMMFINRRGYSSFLRCTTCGYVANCERCDVSLVYHKGDALKCHFCGNRYGMPTVCPKCQAKSFRRGYIGTQQVVEKLGEVFPDARVLRMDNDTTQTKNAHAHILGEFKDHKADILVGTQMIAKGHDFSTVTLVGILDADVSLHFSDYKATERTFQLITQVSGRAGRADKKGYVVLQTYSPTHYVYRLAVANDYLGFYKKEVNLREVTLFPPFANILRILVTGIDQTKTAQHLKTLYTGVQKINAEDKGCFAYLSYMYSPIKKIKGITRMQILCRITHSFDEIIKKVYNLVNENKTRDVSVFVEINPGNLN